MTRGSILFSGFLAVFAAAGAAVTWPAMIDARAPGWTKATAGLRTLAFGTDLRPTQAARPVRPPVKVSIEKASRGPFPNSIVAVGTVQPIASVALRSRIDATIVSLAHNDGDAVRAGEPLVKLDDRQLLAQIDQVVAQRLKDATAVEQAQRDIERASLLLTRGSGPSLNLDNAKTALATARAAVSADEAQIENLKVQDSWYTLRAPISGRLGVFSAKEGNVIRTADNSTSGVLATINKMAPIYVALPVPQVHLAQLREGMARGKVTVIAAPQGGSRSATGEVTEIENLVDAGTGTVMVHATFANNDELLWPGELCNVRIILWTDPDDVTISRLAPTMVGETDYVYEVEDGVARKKSIAIDRFQDGRYVVSSGLNGGEALVDDGKDFLGDTTPVEISSAPPTPTADETP